MTNKKKKHHYLPQFYVGGFSNQIGEVFVLNTKTGQIKKQGKKGTFHLPYFYTVDFSKIKKRSPESTGKIKKILGVENIDTSNVKEYPDMVEDLLSESEDMAAKIIRKLNSSVHISNYEKIEFSTFVALMYARNPIFRKITSDIEQKSAEHEMALFFSQKDNVRSTYKKMLDEGYENKINLEKVFEIVENKRFKIEIPRELNIQTMLVVAPIIDQIIYQKTWFILESPEDNNFITNDNPVFLLNNNISGDNFFGAGFKTPGVNIIFPLTKKSILIMKDTQKDGYVINKKINADEVAALNRLIYSHSGNYVISCSMELFNNLKK